MTFHIPILMYAQCTPPSIIASPCSRELASERFHTLPCVSMDVSLSPCASLCFPMSRCFTLFKPMPPYAPLFFLPLSLFAYAFGTVKGLAMLPRCQFYTQSLHCPPCSTHLPQNDLEFLRLRSEEYELMVAPRQEFVLIVV